MPRLRPFPGLMFALALALVLLPLAAVRPAHASSQVTSPTLWETNGIVGTTLVAGNTLYLGGQFTRLGLPIGSFVAIDGATATPDAAFPVVEGSVRAIVADGSGGWFIGGAFIRVGDQARTGLAHIRADKSVDPNWAPTVSLSGGAGAVVDALALSGGIVYVGGEFDRVTGDVTRNNLAAFDATSGALVTAFDPNLNSMVAALALSGDGSTLYAGGAFTTVNGSTTRNRLAAFTTADGSVTAFNPNLNSMVNALALSGDGSTLYAGGTFSTVNGATTRNRLVAFNTAQATNNATTFNPNVNGPVNALALSGDGSTLYAGGDFTQVNGATARSRLAAFDTAQATDNATAFKPSVDGSVLALALSGSNLYVGGAFTSIGAPAVARNNLAVVDTTSGDVGAWNPNPSNFVRALAANSTTVYAGGDFRFLGGVTRNNLAAIDLSSGAAVTAFDPNVDGLVQSLALSGTTLYAGGDFSGVNGGTPRNRLAAFNTADGSATAFNPNMNSGVYVLALSSDGSTLYAGGVFTTVNGGTARRRLAAFNTADGSATAFNPNLSSYVTALALSGDGSTLYAGGGFTTVNGGTPRNRLAAFTTADGSATAFDPNLNGSVSDLALSGDGSTLFAGGSFSTVNGGTTRRRLAAFTTAGTATAWNPDVGDTVEALALAGPVVYAGGEFTSVGTTKRSFLAALNAGPVVTTGAASNLSASSATLNGTVSTFDLNATPGFALTTTSGDYTNPVGVAATPASVTGTNTQAITGSATGLTSNSTYYYRAGATSVMGTFYGAEQSLTTLPAIATQPAASSIASGKSATLSVTVPGAAQLTYQWYEGAAGDTSKPVAGATSASFTTPALSKSTSYWVRITNAGGSVDSTAATVTVTATDPVLVRVYLPLAAK